MDHIHLLHLDIGMDILHGRCFIQSFGSFQHDSYHTPLHLYNWHGLLSTYPDKPLVILFITSLINGFRVGFKKPLSQLRSALKNLIGALQHPQVVDDYLKAEITEHRVFGAFHKKDISAAHVSRFGVIPKNHAPNKWRLVVDLSHPPKFSVNDGIPKELCSLTYISVDTAIDHM